MDHCSRARAMPKAKKEPLKTRKQRKTQAQEVTDTSQAPGETKNAVVVLSMNSAFGGQLMLETANTMEQTLRTSRRLLDWNVDDQDSRELCGALRWFDMEGRHLADGDIRHVNYAAILPQTQRMGLAFRTAEEIFVELPELCNQFFRELETLIRDFKSVPAGYDVDREEQRIRRPIVGIATLSQIKRHCEKVSQQTFAENPQRYSMSEAVFLGYAENVHQFYAFNLPDLTIEWIRLLMSEGIFPDKRERMRGKPIPSLEAARLWLLEVLVGNANENYTRFMKMASDCMVLAEYGMLSGRRTVAQHFVRSVIELVDFQERIRHQAMNAKTDDSDAAAGDGVRLTEIERKRRGSAEVPSDATPSESDDGSAHDEEYQPDWTLSDDETMKDLAKKMSLRNDEKSAELGSADSESD